MSFPVATGVPSMSGTYIPEIWAGKLLEKFYTATVFGEISNTDYEGEITNMGDKVNVRTIPDITIGDYTKGMNLNVQNPEGDVVELLIDKGKYYNVNISDVDQKQSDINFMDRWGEDAGEQMKIQIDSDIISSIYSSPAAYNKGATAGKISENINLGVSGTPVTVTKSNVIDKIVEAGQALDEQDVPETGRWMVIPAWMATRLKTSDLKDASMTGDGKSVLRNGRIGMIDRWTLYSSNQLYHVTDGSDECFHILGGHKGALTFASQLVKNEVLPNPNDFGQLMRGLHVYGYKVLKPESMIDLYCCAG